MSSCSNTTKEYPVEPLYCEIIQSFEAVEPIDDLLSGICDTLNAVVEDVGMQYTIVHNSMIKFWLRYLADNDIDDLTESSRDLFQKAQELSMCLLDMWEDIRLVKPLYGPF